MIFQTQNNRKQRYPEGKDKQQNNELKIKWNSVQIALIQMEFVSV